jgi:hypothetical protein
MTRISISTALCLTLLSPAFAQRAVLRPAERAEMPGGADSNSPGLWTGNRFRLFTSQGIPLRHSGPSVDNLFRSSEVTLSSGDLHLPMWIESVWPDPQSPGRLYAWYHHEVRVTCGATELSVPMIGALVSRNSGNSFDDLGIILASGDPYDCTAQNGYFAGGHGDFTVIPDRRQQYFYFLYSNYGGPVETQGIAVARLAVADRDTPTGAVWKFHLGGFTEPGIGGRQTAIFPARVGWQDARADSFWGPSLHWNSFLDSYVMLLNRSCCEPGWPQEGIYLSYNNDLSNPMGWTQPALLLEGGEWYPQLIGRSPGETDSTASEVSRFYMLGKSDWELVFQ